MTSMLNIHSRLRVVKKPNFGGPFLHANKFDYGQYPPTSDISILKKKKRKSSNKYFIIQMWSKEFSFNLNKKCKNRFS